MSILNLFCHVDDFCQWLATWENAKLLGVARKRGSALRLSLSEVMTILIHFHQSHYRDFKASIRSTYVSICAVNSLLWSVTHALWS